MINLEFNKDKLIFHFFSYILLYSIKVEKLF